MGCWGLGLGNGLGARAIGARLGLVALGTAFKVDLVAAFGIAARIGVAAVPTLPSEIAERGTSVSALRGAGWANAAHILSEISFHSAS